MGVVNSNSRAKVGSSVRLLVKLLVKLSVESSAGHFKGVGL